MITVQNRQPGEVPNFYCVLVFIQVPLFITSIIGHCHLKAACHEDHEYTLRILKICAAV